MTLVDAITKRVTGRSEATLQSDIRALLLSKELGLTDSQLSDPIPLESPLGDGTRRRIDIEAGGTVIEVKRDLTSGTVEHDAVEQLAGYVQHKVDITGNRFVGVLTDGSIWRAYALDPSAVAPSAVSEIVAKSGADAEALLVWLEAVMATREEIVPLPEEIERRLGVESPAYKIDHANLCTLLERGKQNLEISLKKQLWSRLLKTALGDKFADRDDLFVDHTLLVLEANIIGHAVVGLDLTRAQADPRLLVDGAQFVGAQIYNVVEDDLFGWVLDVEGGDQFLRNLIRQISRFAWHDVKHDVLKVLYESVISAPTRKSLGEYFTPDWLAERVIAASISDPLNQRVLDPACGSGTFVFHAVRHLLDHAQKSGMSNSDALDLVQRQVFGMDIHPVSVVLARVTYLLAIGRERLLDERHDITVPVYLGDSMQWDYGADAIVRNSLNVPIEAADLTSGASNTQGTLFPSSRELEFPLTLLDDPAIFDRFVDDLARKAQQHTNPKVKPPSIEGVLDGYGVADPDDRTTLRQTFRLLCELNAEGRNHIWGFFVRNQVRPRWWSLPKARVDVLVGNPPWVAYRYMTASMQKQFKAFCQARDLWAGGAVATTQDLVGLFISRTVEQFLRGGGSFAFVVPRAVLSRKQYEGFRRGRWNTVNPLNEADKSNTRVRFDDAWDLLGIDCAPDLFPVPAAVVFGERAGGSHGLPESVTKIVGKLPARNIDLAAVAPFLKETKGRVRALSVDDESASPYSKLAFQGAILSPRVLVYASETEASPLGGSSRRVNITSARSTHEPWSMVAPLQASVERAFQFKVHLRSTIVPFGVQSPATAILPISKDRILTERQIDQQPGLADWWSKAKAVWEAHRTANNSELEFVDNLDWLGKLSRQLGKGGHRVVYTASGTTLMAARLTDGSDIVDNSLYWIAVPTAETALYLTAILNSKPLLALIAELQAVGNFGARHFHKLPFYAAIPAFNAKNLDHARLAELAVQAEVLATESVLESAGRFGAVKTSKLVWSALAGSGITAEIDLLAAKLI